MRIITINLPVSFIKIIDSLTGHDGLYPSRSELVRVAVRDFLIHDIDSAKSFKKYAQAQAKRKKSDEKLFVQVPMDNDLKEFKTYKLVQR